LDVGDLDSCKGLAMTASLFVTLAPLELENNNLLRTILLDYAGTDRSAAYLRCADFDVVCVTNHQDFVESNFITYITGQLLDSQLIALRNPVLFSACFDYRIHGLPTPQLMLSIPEKPQERRTLGTFGFLVKDFWDFTTLLTKSTHWDHP
jgi:hypothetical protein